MSRKKHQVAKGIAIRGPAATGGLHKDLPAETLAKAASIPQNSGNPPTNPINPEILTRPALLGSAGFDLRAEPVYRIVHGEIEAAALAESAAPQIEL